MNNTYATIFSGAFRPLFLLAGLYAPLVLLLWLGYYFGGLILPAQRINPFLWHSHEMVFGFVAAAMGGFVFTAVSNWTGRPPIQGTSLLVLCSLWLLGRIAMLFLEPGWLAMLLDLTYLFLVIVMLLRELYLGQNRRNYIVAAVFSLLFLFNVTYHLELSGVLNGIITTSGASMRGAILSVVIMLALIGGRIIPAFSGNWLRARAVKGSLPANFGRLDIACLLSTVLVLLIFVPYPLTASTGAVLIVTALLHSLRLARWQTLRIAAEPLLLVLHVAYGWIPIGLLLLAASSFQLVTPSAGIHALTIGAITTMIMAVAIRAGKGHSGRPLTSDIWINSCFILISLAAALRVVSSFIASNSLITISALAWLLAFGIFLVVAFPILVFPPSEH
ncbi:MAG TPA: hypothetical protein DCM64_10915 [Gammaproteobacteria bacterium]|jgi:uncharacterized protein involved in response to NO|nr:NnrS family protein [Gammaproteobacteria bacterium]HAJ76952.1 hypothetical protein [Gammaproteobacteria bacterium]|tara:strand:+ start:2379 stop:3548 length:1170 start_codon:yes stop_codon:yes gene_type:complete